MVEAALRAALKVGIAEDLFWRLTPYRLGVHITEANRARAEQSLFTGWFAERFAREERLQAPQQYISDMLDGTSDDVQQAMAEAELTRMAMGWGLTLEDVEDPVGECETVS